MLLLSLSSANAVMDVIIIKTSVSANVSLSPYTVYSCYTYKHSASVYTHKTPTFECLAQKKKKNKSTMTLIWRQISRQRAEDDTIVAETCFPSFFYSFFSSRRIENPLLVCVNRNVRQCYYVSYSVKIPLVQISQIDTHSIHTQGKIVGYIPAHTHKQNTLGVITRYWINF